MRKTSLQTTRLLGAAILVCALLPSRTHGQCEITQINEGGGLGFIATDGDVAVFGDVSAFGSVFVFRKGTDGPDDWIAEATLISPDPDSSDQFGRSVAVNADYIVVGAYAADAPDFNSGAAYVYHYDPNTKQWPLETTLTASDGDLSDKFGWSVAIDGDVILIGARDDENHGAPQSGSAYVFRFNGLEWIQEAKLYDPNGGELDIFGISVDIKSDIALIGAVGNQDAGGGTGAAFIFRHDAENLGQWNLEQQLQAFDAQWQAWFGFRVSLSNNNVALIGAPEDDGQTGAAYVMQFNGKQWVHEAKLVATNPVGPFPLMGSGVSISADGNTVLSGAPLDDEAGNEAGAAHLFRKDGEEWTEITKLTASDGGPGQDFAEGVAINGDIVFIKGGQNFSTKIYIFAGIQGIDCNENGETDACEIFNGDSNDQNNNGIPDECDADLDGNGIVNTSDLLILFGNWGPCSNCEIPGDCPADLDGSCSVNTTDLLILFSHWG